METFTYDISICSLSEMNVDSDRDCHINFFSTHCRGAVHMTTKRVPFLETIRRLRIHNVWSIEVSNAVLTGERRLCDLLRKPKLGRKQALVPFLFCPRHKLPRIEKECAPGSWMVSAQSQVSLPTALSFQVQAVQEDLPEANNAETRASSRLLADWVQHHGLGREFSAFQKKGHLLDGYILLPAHLSDNTRTGRVPGTFDRVFRQSFNSSLTLPGLYNLFPIPSRNIPQFPRTRVDLRPNS